MFRIMLQRGDLILLKRVFAAVLVSVFCLTVFCGCSGEKVSKFTSFSLFAETENPTPYMLSDGKIIGVYINPVRSICGFEVTVASPNGSVGNVTLSVYEFTTDYASSLEGTPLAKGTFTGVTDGQRLYFQFEDLPMGRYILTASSDSDELGLLRQASLPSLENRADFYYQFARLDSGAFAFTVVCRTSRVSGLTGEGVFAVPDYSVLIPAEE